MRWLLRSVLVAGALVQIAALLGFAWLVILVTPPVPQLKPILTGPVGATETGVGGFPHSFGGNATGDCTRILSIDGGGVRGISPALMLAELERRTGKPIASQFDLIVGTSTGAILALGLTRPSEADAHVPAYHATDLVNFYRDHAADIFPNGYSWARNLQRIFRPKYDSGPAEDLFTRYFGDVQLIEALTEVAVPAYEIEDRERLWFESIESGKDALLMRDIVRGASAAPTFLPPAQIAVPKSVAAKGYLALVDGALFANNPASDALGFGRALRPDTADKSVLLLSLGTGTNSGKHAFASAWSWGILGWVDPLLEIAISDPAIEAQVNRSLRDQDYMRLAIDLGTSDLAIDDSSSVALERLTSLTNDFLKRHEDDLQLLVRALAKSRGPGCGMRIGADYERPDGPRQHAVSTGTP